VETVFKACADRNTESMKVDLTGVHGSQGATSNRKQIQHKTKETKDTSKQKDSENKKGGR